MIYYKDVYQSSLDGVTEMKAYLENIFEKRVRFIPNTHIEAIRKTGLIFWKKTTAEERYKRFKPLMSNYRLNEFDEFLSDLEYCSFMKFYGLRRTAFNNSKLPIKLIADLSDIWGVYEKDNDEEEKEDENKDKK